MAWLKAYDIPPVKADWSGWTTPGGYVAEVMTANFDSLGYVELFAGAKGNGGAYRAGVWLDGSEIMWSNGTQTQNESWVKFENWNTQVAFTKGKQLEFRFSRTGQNERINFYVDQRNRYPYGHAEWGGGDGQPPPQTSDDLCCRVYSRLNATDSAWWGMIPWFPVVGEESLLARRARWLAREQEAPIGIAHVGIYWDSIQPTGPDSYDFTVLDTEISYLHDVAGIEIHARLTLCPRWASSRMEPDNSMSHHCAPRNLWVPWPSIVPEDTNYWARWLDTLVEHYGDTIHTWEIWNEPNDTGPPAPGITGWWRRPNTAYTTGFDSLHGLCSLYVRLVEVAYDVITGKPGHEDDLIVMGGMAKVSTGDPLIPGKEWLRTCYEVAGGSRHWNVVSAHPYQWEPQFDAAHYESEAETLRAIMRADSDYVPLWNTEFGWSADLTGEPVQAHNVCEGYVATKASEALPSGGYDRLFWFSFRDHPGWDPTGLLDSTLNSPRNSYYAYAQTQAALFGKRFNGRVLTGDTRDDSVRMYEFENPATLKRTWVCWKNGGQGQNGVNVDLPATVDTLTTDSLAYSPPQQSGIVYADVDGWLPLTLDERPVFISEGGAVSRPDMVVDSVWSVPGLPTRGQPVMLWAKIKNLGTDSTGTGSPNFYPNTSVRFYVNGSFLSLTDYFQSIPVNGTVVVSASDYWTPSATGPVLASATVNEQQSYVELGTDDNAGYRRYNVVRYPTGVVDVVVPPGGKTDAALLPMRLTSHSWETDSISGQTPADSARILFAWYGQRDSVVHAADTTAWFPFRADTVLQFPRGCGRFKVYAQFRDSGANDSPAYPDSADTVVVFDSVPAVGSIVINHGARFAPSATCTLRLAAYDSASGVGWMRFSNSIPRNLVRNGAFAQTDGSWSFYGSGSGYDSSLQMAVLAVNGPQECRARQFVPAESITAHFGDSCVLEANILAHMHGGTASGNASFWYWRTRTNPNLHDTMWTSIATASYSGDVISKTGRDNLSARFLLAPPTSYQGWVWRGGMVKVKAQGVSGGTGKVWADNVALHPFQAQSGWAWWGTYDTLAAWGMGSAAGQHVIRALYLDSAGTESGVALADTVILDPTAPAVHISVLQTGQYVSDTVEITGWAYDSVEVPGDTWFASYRLQYKNAVSGDWQGIDPDSVSYTPVYSVPVSGVPRHLGYWSTDSLPDGDYYLMLTATDSVGHTSSCTTWVVIANDSSGDDFRAGPPGGGSGLGEGSIYIGSTTGEVLHLSEDLDSLDCFSVTDSGTQAYVTAILEVSDDSLLILDARNKRIHKLHRNGQNRRRLVSNLSIPAGVTRDENGNFWLVDKGIHKIGKFRSNGTLVFTRGGLGADSLHFYSPEAIAVKGSLVYVADTKNDRIAVWDTSGSFTRTIKGDFENPTAVTVTDSGSIYLTDGTDGKLKGINPRGGSFLTIAEANGSQFQGLVLSENGHSLFTLAPQPNTVHKLRIRSDDSTPGGQQSQSSLNLPKLLNLAQPFPNPARSRLNINYALPRQTRVSVKLYDIAGKLTTTLASGDKKPGYYNVVWNRQDAKGRTCACGVYFCALSAEGKRFTRKVVLTE
jgi:sugar lactone lactonase YvrE